MNYAHQFEVFIVQIPNTVGAQGDNWPSQSSMNFWTYTI